MTEPKTVNILSLTQAFSRLGQPIFQKYIEQKKTEIRDDEIGGLSSLISNLQKFRTSNYIFEDYYLGYKIPQISKEFDVLRIGKNIVVNIELKSKEVEEDKILKQLSRNLYYLKFTGKSIYCYTFVMDTNKLYYLNDDKIEIVEIKHLYKILMKQEIEKIEKLSSLFNPSNYLVSPFNSTLKFINGEYFLTSQQEEIKNDIVNSFQKKRGTFFSVVGRAGTGKTLLVYDVVKEQSNEKPLIIHCGLLNNGHTTLRDKFNWEIISIRSISNINLADYGLLVLDEVQRIRPHQLRKLIKSAKQNKINCLFSYDQVQCLRHEEARNNVDKNIISPSIEKKFELTKKIRTNKGMAHFIKGLFNKNFRIAYVDKDNIEIKFFENIESARKYLLHLKNNDWKVINYTSSNRQNHTYDSYSIASEDNAHRVIGQEFDKVVAVIDHHFCYNENNALVTRNHGIVPYYSPNRMLFQIVSRVRRKLCVVIIDNEIIFERCLGLLN